MATRVYGRETGTAPITPAVDAAWETSAAPWARKPAHTSVDVNDALTTVTAFTSTTGQDRCHRQWICRPMAAGNVFDTGVTYKAYTQVLESATNDNCVSRLGVRILSEDGGTVRHTVLAVADYSTATEFNTAIRAKAFANGDAGTGSYTTVDGDRLCIEWGHNDAAGASISANSRWGSAGLTDSPENETSVSTTERPWFECSLTIVFKTPTTVERYVDAASSAGGDGTTAATTGANRAYVSLNAALTALDDTDWATANQSPRINCGGSTADTVAASMGTTWSGKLDKDCTLRILTNQPNALQLSTSHYRLEVTNAGPLSLLGADYATLTLLSGRHIIGAGAGSFTGYNIAGRVSASDTHLIFDRCRLKGEVDNLRTSICGGFRNGMGAGAKVTYTNCVSVGYKATGNTHIGFILDPSAADVAVYNCTSVTNGMGFTGSASSVLKNCGASDCTDPYNGTFSASGATNASTTTDAPGTSPRNSVTPTFVNAAGGDYHLAGTDTAWKDQGTDLSADARYAFTTDGDGEVRTAPWDIGADDTNPLRQKVLAVSQAVQRAATW